LSTFLLPRALGKRLIYNTSAVARTTRQGLVGSIRLKSNASRKVAAGEKKPSSLKSVNDANGGDGDMPPPADRLPRPRATGHGRGPRSMCRSSLVSMCPKNIHSDRNKGFPLSVLLQTAEPQGKSRTRRGKNLEDPTC
jgi:hypothetical protein